MILENITQWEKSQKESFQKGSPVMQKQVEAGNSKGYNFNEFTQDLFSSLYQASPRIGTGTPGSQWAREALEIMQGLREFQDLRKMQTMGNSFASGIGASALAQHFAETLPVHQTDNPDHIESQIKDLESYLEDLDKQGKPTTDCVNKINKLKKDLPKATGEWSKPMSDQDREGLRIGMRKALSKAQNEASEIDSAIQSFGFGSDPGKDGFSGQNIKQALAQKIQSNPKLKAIADLAGRFKREARAIQSAKKNPGPDELTGVEMGGSIEKVMPTEFIGCDNDLMRLEFLQRLAEKRCLQYKCEKPEKKNKGPVIVCIDNSGSMSGSPEVWSKAVALALCRIAVDQKRPFAIIHFATEVCRVDSFTDPNKVDPSQLLDSCAYFNGGGTQFNPALNAAMDLVRQGKATGLNEADIIFVTDGQAEPISPDLVKAKQDLGVKVFGICIGCDSPILKEFSDHYSEIRDLANDQEVKETLFSI